MATLSYRDAVGKALQDSMRDEPRLFLIGQNLAGHALRPLAETYGEARVRDTSISESAMVGMAVGAAMKGMKAVVMIAYADIASVCTWRSFRARPNFIILPMAGCVVR